ncbi:hypothetical protein QIS99_05300 [Streptomyces sp. B-S-A8]|uniref:DUF3592 domain-containing protein n=1 Tax=Streptomyces solicavernae TaxID=3043614 RepID=A0ABT6RMU3_9ACTN|nr:hypothetical protein [Streptomyces sp. B-S-A8]MDI3385635.1 hypothetical protein [Streptomyces sp. B-S-A8]
MLENTRGAGAPDTLDTAALRRKLVNRVWWTGSRNIVVYGLMAFATPGLGQEAKKAGMAWVPALGGPLIFIGIIGFLGTLFSIIPAVFIVRGASRTLAHYTFDTFIPQVTKVDGAEATKGRPKNMTLTLHTADGNESPLMRINPVPRRGPWRNPWPEDIDNGLYIAGDPHFGVVGYVPSSGVFLFMQPDDWDGTAGERRQASPERARRAAEAELNQRIV